MTITTNRSQKITETRSAANLESTLTLAAGAALTGVGVWRRDWIGAALAVAGGYLLYSGARDLPRSCQGSVRVAVTIARDRDEVYRFMSGPENWPRFLASIRIQPREAGRLELEIGKAPKRTIESSF